MNYSNASGLNILHYQVKEKLGEGGGGYVYKAIDTRLNRIIVLKILRENLAAEKSGREGFLREARLASQLDYPNICTIFGIHEFEDTLIIAMQYVQGKALNKYLLDKAIDLPLFFSIANQVLGAVRHAHRHNIIHRDLKPSNIIINEDGQCKILDFGLAISGGSEHNADPETEIFGTPLYTSPEMAAGKEVKEYSDIFSLGIMFYQMLSGTLPFKGHNKDQVLKSILEHSPERISHYNKLVPPALEQWVFRMLEKEGAKRYQHLDQASEIFLQIYNQWETSQNVRQAVPEIVAVKTAKKKKKKPILVRLLNRIGVHYDSDDTLSLVPLGRMPDKPQVHGIKNLVILPFKNLGDESKDDFYSIALADYLISELNKIKSLRMVPVSYLKGYERRVPTPEELKKKFKANLALYAEYRLENEAFAFHFSLINLQSDEQVYSDERTVPVSELPVFQDKLLEDIIQHLEIKLSEKDLQRIQSLENVESEAYEYALRARHTYIKSTFQTYSKDELDNAVAMYEASVKSDPQFYKAWGELGVCYVNYVVRGAGGKSYLEKAETCFTKALKGDASLLEPRVFGVYIHLSKNQKENARLKVRDLLVQHAQEPMVHFVAANLFRWDGLYDEALREYSLLDQLLPVAAAQTFSGRGRIYTFMGNYDKALAEFDKGLALEPSHSGLKSFKAFTLICDGEYDRAWEILHKLVKSNQNLLNANIFLAIAYCKMQRFENAEKYIQPAVIQFCQADADGAYWLGTLYALMGERDKAIRYLSLSTRLGYENYPWMQMDPHWESLRDDKAYLKIIKRLERSWQALNGI